MNSLWLNPTRKPLIVAHRGFSASAPENTLAAFELALKYGADAIELDIRLTKDEQIIVIHDNQVNRTTDGRGFVRNLTLSELKKLNAGLWYHRKYSSEKILTLAEVFGLLRGKIAINVEIKTDRLSHQTVKIVDRCFEIIMKHNIADDVLLSSFEPIILQRVRNLHRTIAIGFLYDPLYCWHKSPLDIAVSLDARFLILSRAGMRNQLVAEAHKKNILVAEFTVNTERHALRSLRYGADAIITNDPGYLKDIIAQQKKSPQDRGLS